MPRDIYTMDEVAERRIGGDVPLRLDNAASIAFPDGSMTGATLRREAAKGRLAVERIAGKLYTTLSDIQEMRRRCRAELRDLGSGSNQDAGTAPMSSEPSGASSTTEESSSAQDAAKRIVAGLKASLRNTSTGSASRTDRSSSRRRA